MYETIECGIEVKILTGTSAFRRETNPSSRAIYDHHYQSRILTWIIRSTKPDGCFRAIAVIGVHFIFNHLLRVRSKGLDRAHSQTFEMHLWHTMVSGVSQPYLAQELKLKMLPLDIGTTPKSIPRALSFIVAGNPYN